MARVMNPFTNKLERSWWSSPATEWSWVPSTVPTRVWEEYLDTATGTWYKSIWTASADDRVIL